MSFEVFFSMATFHMPFRIFFALPAFQVNFKSAFTSITHSFDNSSVACL